MRHKGGNMRAYSANKAIFARMPVTQSVGDCSEYRMRIRICTKTIPGQSSCYPLCKTKIGAAHPAGWFTKYAEIMAMKMI